MNDKLHKGQTKSSLKIEPFEQYTERYEKWFDKNKFAYLSELKGIKSLLPTGEGIEIGVGTGKFAEPLSIGFGVDPSLSMLEKARIRNIRVLRGVAEELPVAGGLFDFALITTTLCFLKNIVEAFKEAKRVLKEDGSIILGFIDRESFLGESYMKKKENNPFYKFARFYSVKEIKKKLEKVGFSNPEIKQTLFTFPEELNSIDYIKDSYGEGGFVIIRMRKNREV